MYPAPARFDHSLHCEIAACTPKLCFVILRRVLSKPEYNEEVDS